ncbi:AIR synthase family protein [bacterium]|nr:AIR synthase family protein [bacterium]
MSFPPGKLPVGILERLIRTYTSTIHGVVVGASIGEDAAAIDFGEKYLLAKTDPVTFVAEDIGTYTIFVNSNDIASMGGRPRWFLATVLLPENGTTEELVERIFDQLSSACRRIDVAFCGGHTEITVGIDRPILVGTMLGEVEKDRLITTGGARPGDDILLTKAIAIEGTSILARERGEEIAGLFGEEFLARCRNLAEKPGISVLEDARIAMQEGRVHAMHDPTEGGLANALHEVAAAADAGLLVEEERIPILDECRILCRHYGLDPLGFIASGSLLIMVEPSDSGKIKRSLEEAGVPAAIIGRITGKEEGVKSRSEGRTKDLPRFDRDEITKILQGE